MHISSPGPDDAARSLLAAGIAASQNNHSAEALSLFAEVLVAAPGWALPHFLMGSEYASLGQWDKAEAELANAVLLEPGLHIARYQLGLLQFSSGRAAAALVTWQPLSELSTDLWLADFVQGFAALAQDAFADAKALFERGLARPDVYPAVAGDVQKVLAAFPGEKTAESANQSPVGAAAEPTSHVLVANYGAYKLH